MWSMWNEWRSGLLTTLLKWDSTPPTYFSHHCPVIRLVLMISELNSKNGLHILADVEVGSFIYLYEYSSNGVSPYEIVFSSPQYHISLLHFFFADMGDRCEMYFCPLHFRLLEIDMRRIKSKRSGLRAVFIDRTEIDGVSLWNVR